MSGNANGKKGFGPLELVIMIMIAVVIGILASKCNPPETTQPIPPQPTILRTAIQGR